MNNGSSRNNKRTSVVGSTVSDVSSRLQGRGLPRGGIREQDGLKVDSGTIADSTFVAAVREQGRGRNVLRVVAIVSGILLGVSVIVALVLAILSRTSAFTITSIETYDSEHITAENVAQLASIPSGTTLLTVDEKAIEDSVKRNPWVSTVEVQRAFPETLRIVVHERSLGALVSMGTGGVAWLMGDDGAWIEPTHIEASATESTSDAALTEAGRLGVLLISDVPATVSPVAGSEATDAVIEAVWTFEEELSPEFRNQVVAYTAATADDISAILANGVEVSLGSPTSIETKEQVARRVLDQYAGKVTYINVRVPSRPTYRRVDSEYVHSGSGATGSSFDSDGKPLVGSDGMGSYLPEEEEEGTDSEYADDGTGSYEDSYDGSYGSTDSYDGSDYGAYDTYSEDEYTTY